MKGRLATSRAGGCGAWAHRRARVGWLIWVLWLSLAGAAQAADAPQPAASARLIVTWREDAPELRRHPLRARASRAEVQSLAQRRAQTLGDRHGLSLRGGRMLDEHTQVVLGPGDAQTLVQRLRADARVAQVSVDHRRRPSAVPATAPNDPLFAASASIAPAAGQWYLRSPETLGGHFTASATRLRDAWALSTGSGVVVAVLDTGVLLTHPDLSSRLLPGRDFVSDVLVANDGDRRDNDASDPGDNVTLAESSAPGTELTGCEVSTSSWHGTQVAGLIGAATDNGQGMAGGAPGVLLLPVRVMGKCGGYDSDIIAAMQWAAGLAVPGEPANDHPARVINLSLGSPGTCTDGYQRAIDQVQFAGAVVVAAAGNSDGLAVETPGNCQGLITVGGLRHAGDKVGYSSLGPEVVVGAPAGNCVNDSGACLFPLLTTSNMGDSSPGQPTYTDDGLRASYGTSFATALVSANVALMLSARPALYAGDVKRWIQASATAFPRVSGTDCRSPTAVPQSPCDCTPSTCGAGMLNAWAAVDAAHNPSTPVLGRASVRSPEPSSSGGGGAWGAGGLLTLAVYTAVLAWRRRRSA